MYLEYRKIDEIRVSIKNVKKNDVISGLTYIEMLLSRRPSQSNELKKHLYKPYFTVQKIAKRRL